MKKKKEKEKSTSEKRGNFSNQALPQKFYQRAITLVRHSEPSLKKTREELRQMNQRTRKLMTMYKALHPRDDIDYMCQKERRKRIHQH